MTSNNAINTLPFTVVIPARFASTRLPAKPLADIAGKPMVQHVYERALQAGATQVIVATDDQRIFDVATGFGATACMTSTEHQSGTERIAEVIAHFKLNAQDIIVNVQGDEPLIPPSIIRQVASNLAINHKKAAESHGSLARAMLATLAVEVHRQEDAFNPNIVKVVTDKQHHALYFSRACIPWDSAHFSGSPGEHSLSAALHHPLKRHIGIYAYRAADVLRYIHLSPSPLEQIESLEQLRVLYHGEKIHVDIAIDTPPAGVDTLEDLEFVRKYIKDHLSRT